MSSSSTPIWLSRLVNTASFGRRKAGWWSSRYVSREIPIIIGGAPRTGSTLLRTILNNHPDIWIGPENGIFQEGGSNLAGLKECTDLPLDELNAQLRQSACLGEFVDRVMRRALQAHGKLRWGIKSPSIVSSMETVFQFFPNARFVHLVRDGRDVVCSLRTHPMYAVVNGEKVLTGIENPWGECMSRWRDATRDGLKWREDPRYYEIRYEELVSQPEAVLSRLLAWLGIEMHAGMLEYHSKPVNEGIDTPHPGVSKPIYDAALRRWKQDLPAEALAMFTESDNAMLAKFGYLDGQ